jgi:hypothetical protein
VFILVVGSSSPWAVNFSKEGEVNFFSGKYVNGQVVSTYNRKQYYYLSRQELVKGLGVVFIKLYLVGSGVLALSVHPGLDNLAWGY